MSRFDDQLAMILETEDWIKQARFSEYIFKRDYGNLIKEFPDLVLIYQEKEDTLLAFHWVAPDRMDPMRLERMASKVFPNFELQYARLYSPRGEQGHRSRQTVSNMLQPSDMEDGTVALGPEDGTGYWSTMLVLHDFRAKHLRNQAHAAFKTSVALRDFDSGSKELAEEAEEVFWNSVEGRKLSQELEDEGL